MSDAADRAGPEAVRSWLSVFAEALAEATVATG
jgi:hypothetical protein